MITLDMLKSMGLVEVIVRVANYQDNTWQVILKYWNEQEPWVCAIHKDPDRALKNAMAQFHKRFRGCKNPWWSLTKSEQKRILRSRIPPHQLPLKR